MKRFVLLRRVEIEMHPRLWVLIMGVLVVLMSISKAGVAGAGPMPSAIVAMPDRGSTVILVEKSTQTLSFYRWDSELVLTRKVSCSTGKMKGRKQESGDQKTPEGVYFFVGKYLEKDLAPIYGAMALPMDYPNLLDRAEGRNGSAIWMHGTDKDLKPMDSNGCVALENNQLEALEKEISLDLTPIIISETIEFTDSQANDTIIEAIDSLLARWTGRLAQGDYHDFLADYAPRYCPPMDWWNEWRSIRDGAKDELPFECVAQSRGIYRDGDVFVVVFRLKLKRGIHEQDIGIRKLYIARNSDTYAIVGDTGKTIHPLGGQRVRNDQKHNPIVRAAHRIFDEEKKDMAARVDNEVRAMINVWLKSWIKGDIEQYGLCYAANFSAGDMDKSAWLERKTYLSRVYDYIDITISEPIVTMDRDQVRVNFRQNYSSSGYSASGQKTLVLVSEDKKWKILQEIWKKN